MTVQHNDQQWRKSKHSGNHDCVEFRRTTDGGVELRNSKRPEEATTSCTDSEWRAFIKGVKDGEFDI
ncbi:DUF397 domain-containing protein [Saccharomonospora saliphila]|uniref:DUF397 domain-containing protein n=1 Tax=Saccharomonospora saliphila TaxID=369829 RepID=UPI0003650B9C|nr:DUF397 domain-containing protein [Saccharomonospora saliphila]